MEELLASIGLSERIPTFREQRISADQFADLTESDLRELGLTIGERRRFQQAFGRKTEGEPLRQPLPARIATGQAEHRPLTVMFVDLVGSTSLGEQLDPEDLLDVLRVYRDFCGEAISRYGGHVARFIGDGILAYFCYPIANENDPERAVRAALDITRGIDTLQTSAGMALQVRIGLATGRVIVSDLFAAGTTDVDTIVGSCPNLAARLQALARPNDVIIAERTYERIAARFSCESLGAMDLRGFAQPQQAWRVTGELPFADTARDTELSSTQTVFVGREAELDLLQVLWRKVRNGDGATALLLGEAGIGKSRLVAQFIRSHVGSEAVAIRVAASAFDENSPLRPFIDHLYRAAGIQASDKPTEALEKLEAVLSGTPTQRHEALFILASLAGIDIPACPVDKLAPDQLRERTIEILAEQIVALSSQSPVCLVVEDLHWLDPTSRELLELLTTQIHGHPILFLMTARTEAPVEWLTRVDATLRLSRLEPGQVAEMMQGLFGEPYIHRLVRQVVDRTDGIPLFVEEVARVLLHRSSASDSGLSPDLVIPASLEESLMARLDRSGVAKEIAQIASVIGHFARRDVLAAVCAIDDQRLEEALAILLQRCILERTHSGRPETYTFHHALLRDAAYASLLRERRRELHERIARALQTLDPEGLELYPEVLALHLTEGGLIEEAAPHWMEAARRNLGRSALTEATRILRHVLTALEKVPQTEATRRLRVEVSCLLGPALIGQKGASAPETQELYNSAYELCQELPEDPGHFPIYWGWWRLSPFTPGRAEMLLERAQTWNDPELLLEAHHCSWGTKFQRAAFHDCRAHMEAGLAIYDHGDYTHHAPLYGNHDPKVCALGDLAQLSWMEGKVREALAQDAQSLSWADKLDHLGSRVHAMGLTLLHSVYRRDYAQVLDRSAKLIALTADHGMADHGAAGLIFQGWVAAMRGEPATGLAKLEEGLARQRAIATDEDLSVYLCLLGETLIKLGRPEGAIEQIRQGISGLERGGVLIWLPELHRILGETMFAADPSALDKVRNAYDTAAALATEQAVPMLGLRVALSRARLDAHSGDYEKALTDVEAALALVPERDGSADFIATDTFLREVRGKIRAGHPAA